MHGALEDLLALEHPLRVAVEARLIRIAAAHAVDAQDFARIAVAAQLFAQQAFLAVRGLQHHGGAAVAEQHRDVAVVSSP